MRMISWVNDKLKYYNYSDSTGASNLKSSDGTKFHWEEIISQYPQAENFYKAHAPCIEAIKSSGVKYVIFCPGYMKSVGYKSVPSPKITIDRPAGGFVSYEDAAQVMIKAAEVTDYDNELIGSATDINQKQSSEL